MAFLSKPYKVVWCEGWDPVLEEALQHLAERDVCPHELYRTLIETPTSARKRAAAVFRRDEVAAVVGLRWQWQRWDPVTHWIIPGTPFPARDEDFLPVLEALGTPSRIALWRAPMQLPHDSKVTVVRSYPTYGIDCAENFEEYWRQSGHLNTVRQMNKRCKDFQFTVNAPGAAEWTIKGWEAEWRAVPDTVAPDLPDRLIAANYLEKKGLHFSFLLQDEGKPIAGHTFLEHGRDLVWKVTTRDKGYEKLGVGTHLMERIFYWAKENGYQRIDLGGGHDYKARWAPPHGETRELAVFPPSFPGLRQVSRLLEKVKSKAAEAIASLESRLEKRQ